YNFFFSSRRRHTRSKRDWSSDVCSSDLSEMEEGATKEDVEEVVNKVLDERGLDNKISEETKERLVEFADKYRNSSAIDSEEVKEQRSEEHTSELQSRFDLVCRLLLEKKKKK